MAAGSTTCLGAAPLLDIYPWLRAISWIGSSAGQLSITNVPSGLTGAHVHQSTRVKADFAGGSVHNFTRPSVTGRGTSSLSTPSIRRADRIAISRVFGLPS